MASVGRRYGNVAGVRASVQPAKAKLKRAYASSQDEAPKPAGEGKYQFPCCLLSVLEIL